MNQVILRFLLEHGHALDIVESPTVVEGIMTNWTTDNRPYSGTDLTGRKWLIPDASKVQAIFTMALDAQQRQALLPGNQVRSPWGGGSGL